MASPQRNTNADFASGAIRTEAPSAWWVLPVLLALIVAVVAAVGWRQRMPDNSQVGANHPPRDASAPPAPRPEGQTVSLAIDFGNGARREFAALPWRDGATIADVMTVAQAFRPAITFVQQGEGDAAFLTAIDGVATEGAGGRYWQILVNDEPINDSFGVHELVAGDRVLWRYGVGNVE